MGGRLRLLAAILALILVVLTGSALATGLSDTVEELEQVQNEIRQAESRLGNVRRQEKGVLDELSRLDQRLEAAQEELSALERNLMRTEGLIWETTQALEEAEAELAEQLEILGARLRALYENGSVTYLEVLLAATDFSEFLQRADLMQEIIAQDVELLESIQLKRQEIDQRKMDLEEQRTQLLILQQRALAKKEQLEADAAQRQALLDQIRTDKKAAEAALDELERTSRELEDMIRRIQMEQGDSGLTAPGKGGMVWPTGPSRRVTSEFGYRNHPVVGGNRMHNGLDIGAPHGQAVVAASAGRVIFSGARGGYGNTVIIDHGGGVSTLYGHNSKLLVSAGTMVSRGQTVARVGSTGVSTGPHVHFEVRVNGTPVNPREWLP